jgi:hypothetical protein
MPEITTGGRVTTIGHPFDAWKQAHAELFEQTASHAPALPIHAVMDHDGNPLDPDNPPTHFVALSSVGAFSRGDVVDAKLFPEGTDFQRLIDMKAVRPAVDQEHLQTRITVKESGAPQNRSVEILLLKKEQENERRRLDNIKLRERIRELESRGEVNKAQTATVAPEVMREKDAAIEGLRTQLQAKTEECNALKEAAGAGKPGKPGKTTPAG